MVHCTLIIAKQAEALLRRCVFQKRRPLSLLSLRFMLSLLWMILFKLFFLAFSSFLPLHEKDVSDEVVQMSRRTGVIFRFC